MIVTLEPTERIDQVNGVRCRVWKGQSGEGVPVLAWVQCIQPQTHEPEALKSFQRELESLPQPHVGLVVDMRYAQ